MKKKEPTIKEIKEENIDLLLARYERNLEELWVYIRSVSEELEKLVEIVKKLKDETTRTKKL